MNTVYFIHDDTSGKIITPGECDTGPHERRSLLLSLPLTLRQKLWHPLVTGFSWPLCVQLPWWDQQSCRFSAVAAATAVASESFVHQYLMSGLKERRHLVQQKKALLSLNVRLQGLFSFWRRCEFTLWLYVLRWAAAQWYPVKSDIKLFPLNRSSYSFFQ